MNIVLEMLPNFLLVFVRITSFFLIAPLFSMRGVPSQYKIGLAFFIALFAFSPGLEQEPIMMDGSYLFLIVKEVFVGLAIGFIAAMLLYAVQVAGAFIDFQMGFALANVMDPQTGAQVPIMGHFKYMLALLFLLAADGHHLLLDGVMRSFVLIPLETVSFSLENGEIALLVSTMFLQMFLIAMQMALPVVGALFLVDVALGILAKTVPQLNIFAVGFPVKILAGFMMLILAMPFFFYVLQSLFKKIMISLSGLVKLLGA
ncbi:flagellar biosynthetic protein FliR [Bacillus sp. FJAT-27251]|uniref:flagellar biosynthetic protein FliR n=1 Tax=Bacillus sp. FJAT-27251 TaxID=1684142 RepID=UPI0006A7D1F8|nr:flagellar biosynthetic protein FliR [Bacillus sp. FJAT-27251]